MNGAQERRLLLAALDYCGYDRACREAQKHPTAVSREYALKKRALAKRRMLRAVGDGRPQLEIDVRPAYARQSKERPV
jgi:hypothetical protein